MATNAGRLVRRQFVLGLAGASLTLLAPSARAEFGRLMTVEERGRLNLNRVGIMGGSPKGKYIELTADLGKLLDDHNALTMRVIGMIGKGSVQNIEDLIELQKVDFAIVQNDVLRDMARRPGYAGIKSKIGYVTKLYQEEIHILAGRDIKSIEDLQGKRVAIGARGTGHRLTADIVFQVLNIEITPGDEPDTIALAKLVAGDLDAMVYVGGKSLGLFKNIGAADVKRAGLHFLAIPDSPMLRAEYEEGTLGHEDYPSIIEPGDTIRTMSVSAVLAVYWWPPDHSRYHSTGRFVGLFFDRFQEFAQPGYADKWQEVDLRAEVRGWRRYPPAQYWLNNHPSSPGKLSGSNGGCIEQFKQQLNVKGIDVEALPKNDYDQALIRFAVGNPGLCG